MPGWRCKLRRMPACWRRVEWLPRRRPRRCSKMTPSAERIWGIESVPVETFLQQVVFGLANGAIYAAVALALVMTYLSTNVVNLAQGEMAMFSTFVAWLLIEHGLPYWLAFVATITLAFIGGVAIERIILRPMERAPILALTIVTIGLLTIFNSLAGWIFDYTVRPFPSPFPISPAPLCGTV